MSRKLQDSLRRIREQGQAAGRPVRIMEVCGTHTMAASRSGLRSLLPENVSLVSGPGCPVCVTPGDYVDWAIAIAKQPDVTVATFGDMVRVPGSRSSLEKARAEGADVRVVYSPLDAFHLAAQRPERKVVFLGVGFETTAPGVAWTIREADRLRTTNYAVLCRHKTIPPAMAALLRNPDIRIDGFLCPGHVSVVIGAQAYEFLARDCHAPCVVAGFEPADMAEGIAMLLDQVLAGRAEVRTQYRRSVRPEGNPEALALMGNVFDVYDDTWRGLGVIVDSGLRIRPVYRAHDAGFLFGDLAPAAVADPAGCRCGAVLKGLLRPSDCPLFGSSCTPEHPVGACMVSSEGACAAEHRYGRQGRNGRKV